MTNLDTAAATHRAQTATVSPSAPLTLCDDERQRCEVWTRVMGYHRPVSSFNIGKKGEFAERKFFHAADPDITIEP